MDKSILADYIDACELIKETEQELTRLDRRKKTIVQGSVKGSMHDFPYAPKNYRIAGTTFTVNEDDRVRKEEEILKERKESAAKIKLDVEEFMNHIPARMQRIIKYKIFEGLSWEAVAIKIGKRATGESIRKEFNRFLEEK